MATTYRAPGDSTQIRHVEGLPFGTRGGLLIEHTFPVDGEYIVAPTLWRNNVGKVRAMGRPGEKNMSEESEVYEVREAARKAKSSEQAIRSALRDGRLKGFRIGRKWLIPRAAFDRLLRGDVA